MSEEYVVFARDVAGSAETIRILDERVRELETQLARAQAVVSTVRGHRIGDATLTREGPDGEIRVHISAAVDREPDDDTDRIFRDLIAILDEALWHPEKLGFTNEARIHDVGKEG